MDPFRADAALHRPIPPGHISSAQRVEKDGTRVRGNVAAHQKHRKNKDKKRDRRQILERLSATLLRLFRGQHGEKRIGYGKKKRGNRDPREGEEPFRLISNGIGNSTTALRRLLIGGEYMLIANISVDDDLAW